MGWRAPRIAYGRVVALQRALDCPEALAWTLVRRGLEDPEAAREFMRSDGPLDDPEQLDGIAAAADRLVLAARRGERVAVHGDYDCDGVCSTAVLTRALRAAGAEVVPFLPSRFTDGYGVRVETVERLADEGAHVLVCVDCGTTAEDALTRAVELGVDPIVCDHHLAGGARPPGIIANPALGRQQDDPPAAVGVVFMLVRALAARLGPSLSGPNPDDELDLVALATVADAVPLIGQNRRLVARGLAAMRSRPRPGIRALCTAAGIDPRTLTARDLGFQLGPTINAAGRLRSAMEALELVLAPDEHTAAPIAERLWALNMERREVEQRITAEAIAQIEASPDHIRDAPAIVAAGDDWHEGVVGIVASRLVERFERPAIVISRDGTVAKGSGRSLPGVDLHDLVSRADGVLSRWGGHAGAVGLQLDAGDVATFRDAFLEAARGIEGAIDRARIRTVDAVVGARELSVATAEAFEALAPFGRGNPPVRLLMPGCAAQNPGTVGAGGRHLAVRLRCGGAHVRAVGFSQGHRAQHMGGGGHFDAHVSLGVERFQGMVGPRVVIERLERVGDPALVQGGCAPACDLACTWRRGIADVRDAVLAGGSRRPPPAPAGTPEPPAGVVDLRDHGAAMARVAALAGADAGVAVVCADTSRRRVALLDALQPQRIGVEVAVLGGVRCAGAALTQRLALAADRPSLLLLDHATLATTPLPDGIHLVVLDPPVDADQARWIRHRAAGRFLHLCWGEHEIAVSRAVAEARWDLRAVAAAAWPALRDGATHAWGPALERILLGAEGPVADVDAVADALLCLAHIGLVRADAQGIAAVPGAPARPLGDAPLAAVAAARLAAAHAFLDRAATLDLLRGDAMLVAG